ncbi:MAG: CCA tRNA nucleotidyltransferase [Candidatus Bathyarchaeota archaeon]|nr:CCA tRNA nucleotidyltransferase [Candidatus Bathyarchaeota archaeon]
MVSETDRILSKVKARISPKPEDRKRIIGIVEQLKERVEKIAREAKVNVEVRLEGSIAKDTWLLESPDIDIFMRVPLSIPKEDFDDVCLDIARKATAGQEQIERFADHPYLEAIVDGIRVNIVPCYDVRQGEWKSATDRTPFHTDYVKPRLTREICGEIRLLKKFMKSIGVYGAEIKVGGFSGYVCELLTVFYGSFIKVLESASNWETQTLIDLEEHYKGREIESKKIFSEQLIIVDPVDRGRNTASAVRQDALSLFIAASRAFLRKPSLHFFYPSEIEPFNSESLQQEMEKRGSNFIFIKCRTVKMVPDILWGKLYKTRRFLRKLVTHNDFQIIRDAVWSDDENSHVFLIEVAHRYLPSLKKHVGPPLHQRRECNSFLQKHVSSANTLSGPQIEQGRWMVEIRREHADIVELLKAKFKDEKENTGILELEPRTEGNKGFKILVNEEILAGHQLDQSFAEFLMKYLEGKPRWLT